MARSVSSETLGTLAFLQGLPDTALWHLARAAEPVALVKGEFLFRSGQPRALMGVVLKGRIAIEQPHEGKTAEIIALGPGEVVGEGLILQNTHHGSDGRATEDTELLVFRKAPLTKLLKDQPALYSALLNRAASVMNDRIKGANATLLGARSDAEKVRADVGEWIDAISALAADVGADAALKAGRDALHAGKAPSELAPRTSKA